jgi:hypothetical protein
MSSIADHHDAESPGERADREVTVAILGVIIVLALVFMIAPDLFWSASG